MAQNIEGLRPLKPKGDAYSDAVRSKQKGSASDKRKMAQRLSRLKLTNPKNLEKKALQLASDPKATALTIMQMITVLSERKDLKPRLQIHLVRALSDAYRTIFGSKAWNVNLNIDRPDSAKNMELLWQKMKNKDVS